MTEALVTARARDGVMIVELSNPPVNTLTPRMVGALDAAFSDLVAAPPDGLILVSAQSQFSAGYDVRGLVGDMPKPALREVCARLEDLACPVIAVLSGPAYGAGAELALAAHGRVTTETASLAFPDVALGVPPSAGATQRLPRLVGPGVALRMLLTGRPVGAQTAHELGLFDAVVADPLDHAITMIKRGETPPAVMGRREKLRDGSRYAQAVQAAGGMVAGSMVAERILRCVEAAPLLPFEAAVSMERVAFEECCASPVSQALRHVFVAERRISAELMARADDGARVLTDAGRAAVERLFGAQDRAIVALVDHGISEQAVDGAMVAMGFETGPFGGAEALPDPDLARKIIAAVMAEGARLLEQGVVSHPSDIDALAVHMMGFPRTTGGPMKAAEQMGLMALERDMREWVALERIWAIPPLLRQASLHAGGFAAVSKT